MIFELFKSIEGTKLYFLHKYGTWVPRILHFSSYLIISGLTAQTSDPIHFKHVIAMTEYAFRLKQQLANVNEHSFNNFQMRIGKKYFRVTKSQLFEYILV